MARRKGKSRRRVKDWKRRYDQGREGEDLDEAHDAETLQKQRIKLPPARVSGLTAQDLADRPQASGMVTGMFRGGAVVRLDGEDRPCSIAKTFRATAGSTPLTVGDEVTVALVDEGVSGDPEADKARADGVVLSRAERRTALGRPEPVSGKRRGRYDEQGFIKVVAANMDTLVIVSAVRQPRLRPGLIDRFVIAAERGEMGALVVVNKMDLAAADEGVPGDLAGGDVPVLCCSATGGLGLEALASAVRGRRSVLAGASGVGKSTLVNALVPGADLPTRPVRSKDERGRHVTATTTVHEMPGGGLIVDTPGVRELAVEMAPAELSWYFPDFAERAGQCRFNDCTHTHEPDCAVREAVESGQVPRRRYERYLRILETI